MILHDVRVHPSKDNLKREDQLAWKIAMLAADKVPVEKDVAAMIVNRIIDNASVAIASVNRHAPMSARDMALGHPRPRGAAGATVFGVPSGKTRQPGMGSVGERHRSARAGHARHVPRRRLLASRRQHPADPRGGADHGEIRPRPDTRHRHRLRDPHRPRARDLRCTSTRSTTSPISVPAQAAGIGTLLDLKPEMIYQAVQQAVHVSVTTRQSRKGEISSWKAYAPAHAGKLAVEAVDRVMRGEGAPSPIYEGEDSVIAWVLDGPQAHYQVPLPAPGEAEARHPRQLHQGAQRRIPVAGADRPGVPHARADPRPRGRWRRSSSTPATTPTT